jgi:hypothetical protein
MAMKIPSLQKGLEFLARNENCAWLYRKNSKLPPAAAMLAEMFWKGEAEFKALLIEEHQKWKAVMA